MHLLENMRIDKTLVLLMSVLVMSCSVQTGLSRQINRPAFSIDSKRLFFEYCADKLCNLVMYNRSDKRLTLLLPADEGLRFASPGLAPKASQVAAITALRDSASPHNPQIVLIDWQRKTFQRLTSDVSHKSSPNFSYDGQKVAYIQSHRERTWNDGSPRATAWDVHTLELATGVTSRKTDFCFYGLSAPFFIPGSVDLAVSGEGPMCNYPDAGTPAGSKGYLKYKERFADDTILRLGPRRQKLEPWFSNGGHSSSPSVAQNGDVLFSSRTNLIDDIKKGYFNYDLFLRREGETRRLTRLKTFISASVLSPDGKYAAYVSDPERAHHFSLWVLDIENDTHEIIPLFALEGNNEVQVNISTLTEEAGH